MKKILNLIIFVLVLVLLFIIIYPQYQSGRVQEIKVGLEPSLNSEILRLIALNEPEKNYKIKLTFKESEDPEEIYSWLKKGEVDLAVLPWTFVLIKHPEIKDFAAAALVSQYKETRPFVGIIGKKGREVKIEDVLSRELSVPKYYGEDVGLLYKHLNSEPSYKPLSMKKVEELINSGDYGFVMVTEPLLSRFSDRVVYLSPFCKNISSPYPGVGFFLKREIVEKKSYIAFRLRLAMNDMIREISRNKDSIKVVILKNKGLDVNLTPKMHLPDWYRVEEFEHFRGLTIEPFIARTQRTLGDKLLHIKTKDYFYTPAELTE